MEENCDENFLTSTNGTLADNTGGSSFIDTYIGPLDPCGDQGRSDTGSTVYGSCDQDRRATDHGPISEAGTVHGPCDQDRSAIDIGPLPRISARTNASLVTMYVMAAAGLLVMCVPFLPRKNSAKTFLAILYILRNITVTLLVVCALIGMIWLTLKVVQLHDQGLVLWPRRCKHCLYVFNQIKLHDKTISEGSISSLQKMPDSSRKELIEKCTTVSNVTLNITYIFSGLVLLSMIPNMAMIFLCFNEHSPQNNTAETNSELIVQSVVIFCLFMFVYILSFYLIPSFYDAHFVAVPKIYWSFLLFIQVAVWISIQKLVRPFAILANGESRTPYLCPLNSTLGEILNGTLDISQPFSVELPVMMACLLIEMWSQNLPKHARSLVKNTDYSIRCFRKCITRRSNWTTLRNFCNKILKKKILSQNSSEHSLLLSNDIEMESASSRNEHSGCRMNNNFISKHHLCNDESTRTPYNKMEIALSITLLICVIYFGISNFLLTGHSELRGHYVQWLLKMMFFTPELTVIAMEMKMSREGDGSYSLRHQVGQSAQDPYESNNKMLLLTLAGACLFDMFSLVSSLGNLFTASELSRDETVLNTVSVFSCVFGLLCKCIQTTFILRVQHQQLKDHREMKWTPFCLLSVGMTNATQWLFDSLAHEEGSSLAWPVLSMFFEGNLGLVIGMLFVPFLHLYELHISIMAYEIYKHPRDAEIS